jgi:hypothetical protein
MDDKTNATAAEHCRKIKTPFAAIIVTGSDEKPLYHILYFDTQDSRYHIGFGSFHLPFVRKWLKEEFEVLKRDQVGRWYGTMIAGGFAEEWGYVCSICGCTVSEKSGCGPYKGRNQQLRFCPNCGTPLGEHIQEGETYMKIIRGGRQSGKTVLALKLSAETGHPIMVIGYFRKRLLMERAKDLGLTIPEPIVWRNRQEGLGHTDKRVIIDDAEQFFQMLLQMTAGVQCSHMTMNVPVLDLDNLQTDFEGAGAVHVNKVNRDIHCYGEWGGEKTDAE